METMKNCKDCGRELPETQFKKTRWGTRASVCNECANAKRKLSVESKTEDARKMRLSEFEPRELMEELARRGYEGKLTFTRVITIDITNF
mgnify:CR=1 FL=1